MDPDVSALAEKLGADVVVSGEGVEPRFLVDWSGDWRGRARALVRPRDVEQVCEVMRWSAETGAVVVAQGGHTGLVGAATPSAEGAEVLLSLDRMNRVRDIDSLAGAATVEAGCVLAHFKEAVEEAGAVFPLSLGAQGVCTIGGVIATNAGGVNVLRHGMMRDLVLGLEVVLADGRVLSDLRPLRKKNVGYDWRGLLIGSEGTLGLVTAASVKLFPKPTQVETLWLAAESSGDVMRLFERLKVEAGDLLSAFELIMEDAVALAEEHEAAPRRPVETRGGAYALIELSAAGGPPLQPWLEELLERLLDEELILDGAIAASGAQAASFWAIREGIVEAQSRTGRHLRTDVSAPINQVEAFLAACERLIAAHAPSGRVIAYGHVGDGNIHLNVVRREGADEATFLAALPAIETEINDVVDQLGGAISAEHGIGFAKRKSLALRTPPVTIDVMRRLKLALDPQGRLAPGRIFELENRAVALDDEATEA